MPTKPRASHSQSGALPEPSHTGRVIARVLLAVLLIAFAFWVARGFLNPLGWAVVVTVASWPAYRKFRAVCPPRWGDGLVPLGFTVLLGIIVFIPLAAAINEAAVASDAITQMLAQFRETGIPMPSWLPQLPLGRQLAAWWSENLSDPANAQRFIGYRSDAQAQFSWARSLGGEIVQRTSMLAISLIATFVLLRRGAEIGTRVLDAADRLFGNPGEQLARKLVETIRGTVTGTTAVALGEGLVLGAAYLAAGVPRPFLFALMTAALAMIPLDAWVVFTFASVLVMMQGQGFAVAFGLFAFGAVVMIVGDTMVWPWLVGKQARLPFLTALIGIFGGIQTFGLLGLFIGPVLLAACWIVLQEWFLKPGEQKAG